MKWFSIFAAGLLALMLSTVAFAQDPQTQPNQQGKHLAGKRAGKLKKMDANQDGQITRDEWKGRDGGFQKIDRNNDGTISREEATAGRQQVGKRQLKRMDADHNRQISRSEWSGAPEVFTKMDKNNDGVLSGRELKGRRRKG